MQCLHPQNTLRISSSTRSICCIAQCEQSGEHEETIAEPELQGIKDLEIQRQLGSRWERQPMAIWVSICFIVSFLGFPSSLSVSRFLSVAAEQFSD